MHPLKINRSFLSLTTTALFTLTLGSFVTITTATAAESENGAEKEIEEIITIGSRVKGRTSLETPVPVDVMNSTALQETGASETGRMLQALAPSFNFSSSSISDGSDSVRPATLRGLGPDQTLVLVNGKRRHTSALIHVNTSVGRGTAGVDMNTIPGIALKRIEVLRDGAAAQYGSDAIAGVINLELRDQNDGGDASISWGQTYEGDGATFVANASYGFEVGDGGFLTFTTEFRDRERTNRAGLTGQVQYPLVDGDCGTACALDPREATFDRRNFHIGDGDSEQKSAVINAGFPLSENAEFYMFGTYSDRKNVAHGFYRRANQTGNTVLELYPDGFLPQINTRIKDHSLATGVEWTIGDDWYVDTSISTGGNSFNFVISNSANASFGPNSPTRADAGTLKISQTTINIDVSKAVEFDDFDLNVAFGAERREEHYQLIEGEPISYADGGAINPNTGSAYNTGFQVFRGFSPANKVDEKRNNVSLYIDLESYVTENVLITLAGRYEDYSDFGSTFNGKLGTHIQLSDVVGLRGAISTGFRAPSMQQQFFNSTSTQFVTVGGVSVAQERGTFRNDSAIAQALGIPTLKEEKSMNFSAGIVASFDNLTLSVDYYNIQIDDRIGISKSIAIEADFPAIAAATGATSGQFFMNLADTSTQGFDVIASYDVELDGDQMLKLSAAFNWTKTDLDESTIRSSVSGTNVGALLTPQDVSIIEEWQPKSRLNVTANYSNGGWTAIARGNMYGTYTVCEGSCDTPSGAGQNIQDFSSKILLDISLSYEFEDTGFKIMIGANNLLDTYPDLNLIGQARGGSIAGIIDSPGVFQYSRRSAPFGTNGGYYFSRISYSF